MLRIRLRRMGARHRPFYRMVVSDAKADPRARAVEEVGIYDPTQKPAVVRVDKERIQHWVELGAQMSPSVKKLVKSA